jgi:hypothetical protein
LKLRPATLADLLGLSPGTQCDFGVCIPIGNSLTGIEEGAGIGLCAANPLGCAIVFTGAVIAYEIWWHNHQKAQTQNQNPPYKPMQVCNYVSEFEDPEVDPQYKICAYSCSDGQMRTISWLRANACPKIQWFPQ